MHRVVWKTFTVALLLNAASVAQSTQSLGDIARANREKLAAQQAAGEKPKVITNKDLPSSPPQVEEADASQPMTVVSGVTRPVEGRASDERFIQQRRAEQGAREQWRGRIEMQESRIADLQARIAQMNASMHRGGGSAQYEGPSNRYQARQMQRVAQMQEMLEQQKSRLSMMQDSARRAGMHTSVYDP